MIKTSKNTVIEYFNSLGVTSKKEVTESAFANFPYTSKTFIIDCYKEWSKSKKVEKDIESSKELTMGELYKIVEEEQKAEKEKLGITKQQEEQAQKTIDAVKAQDKTSTLKVVEDVRRITVEGMNGTYEAETNMGVVLKKETAKISFANEEELEEFTEEFKQVFAMIR